MTAPKPNAPLAYVYDGQQCLGHVLSRGPKGFEAYDRNDRSLGVFETQRQAANALLADNEVALPGEP
jgi:hypothetical protein